MRWLIATVLLLILSNDAWAGDLTVEVRDGAGRPVPDAVVLLRPARGASAPRAPGPLVMAQQDIQFTPHVLVVPVGATVSFPNRDKVRHHVYSFSAPKRFELKLYGRDETRTVTFDKPGPVALGCNIHDGMTGFVYVADTPYAAKTDAAGRATLREAPAGAGALTVWHPQLRAKVPPSRPLTVTPAGQRETVQLDLRPAM